MSLTNRKAPEDTAINRDALTEGLDVRGTGRYYPEEFSSQLQIMQHQGSVLSEIPKALAGIVINYDDYKISSWHDEEQTKINKERIEADNEIRNRENELKLAASVEVYDTNKQMQSELTDKLNQAEVEGASLETAATEVLDKYKEPLDFQDRPMLQQMWGSTYQNVALNTLKQAQAADIKTIREKADYAFKDLMAVGYDSVISGKENPEQALHTLLPQAANLMANLPANRVQERLDELWNYLVIAKAVSIGYQVQKGIIKDPEEGMNALQSLAKEYSQKTFTCTDDKGNILKNSDGTDKTFTVVLTPETQNKLYEVFKVASSGAGGNNGEGILVDYEDEFDKKVGWEEFKNNGFSSFILQSTPESLKEYIDGQIGLISKSSGGISSKANKITSIVKKGAQLITSLQVARELKKGNHDIKAFLNEAITALEIATKNPNIDWAKYTLKVNGVEIGKAGINVNAPALGSIQDAAQTYWIGALDQLKKMSETVTNSSAGELFSKIDSTYNNAATLFNNSIQAGTLTSGEGNSTYINAQGKNNIIAAIQTMDKVMKTYGYGYQAVADSCLDNLIQSLGDKNKFKNKIQQHIALKAIVQSFKNTGHATDLMAYALKHVGSNKANADIMLAFCLDNLPTGNSTREVITETLLNLNPDTEKRYNEHLKILKLADRMKIDKEIYEQLGIPKSHSKSGIYNSISDMCAYATALKEGDAGLYKKYFKEMIQSNYIRLDNNSTQKAAKLRGALFKYSPQMRLFQTPQQQQRLTSILTACNSYLQQVLPENRWKNIQWYSDDENGIFRLVENGRNIGRYQNNFVGTLKYTNESQNLNTDNMGQLTGIATYVGLLMTNPTFRKQQLPNIKIQFTGAEAKAAGLKGTPIMGNYTNTRTASQIYANQDYNFIKDLTPIAKTLYDSRKFNKIIRNISGPQMYSAKSTFDKKYLPNNKLIRALFNINPNTYFDTISRQNSNPIVNLYKDIKNTQQYTNNRALPKEIERGLSTGYATNLDMAETIVAESESATKVKQSEVSLPIELAAVGDESFIDVYNNMQAQGYEITGVSYPGIITDREEVSPEVDKGYLGKLPDLYYTTYLSNKEKQEFNAWVARQREAGNILPEDNFEDYDMQGFWKNEVLNNTEYATATAETHFPDKYKKPNHPTFSNESIYYNEETAHLAGHWEGDKFIPPTKKEEGQPTGYATNIEDPFSGDAKHRPNTTTRKYTKDEMVQIANHYASSFGIPATLVHAVINQESGWQQYVKSKAGAVGVMQLMSKTAAGLGVADSTDAAQNIWGGVKYLAECYKQFGRWDLALAAYNSGASNVIKYKGIPPFPETQRYVKNIMKAANLGIDAPAYPVNLNLTTASAKRKFMDTDTNMLSVSKMNDFIYEINNNKVYKDKVVEIRTNRPELLENKVEYADFKKFRELKNEAGKPLFVKSSYNGIQIMLKNENNGGYLNPLALDSIAQDAYNNQTTALSKSTKESVGALVNTFSSRYKDDSQGFYTFKSFGLANLTAQEYENYGVPIYAQQSPIMQARVLATEFQRANDILGSERKAVYALAGGKLIDENGSVKSWAEIKKDNENFMKQWFIKPSSDEKERNQINAIVAMYNSEYNRLRRFI